MDWALAASLLAKYGPELVFFILQRIEARGQVTLQEWAELQALAAKTPQSQLEDALARAGVPKDDPRAVELRKLLESNKI